jgi:hypothetical protein
MNNINRVGLVTASLVATVLVAGVFIVDGYTTAQGSALAQTPAATSSTQNTPLPPPAQTIYVMPAPTPGHVTITQTAPNSTPPVTHIIVAGPGGDDGGSGDR